MAEKSKEQKAKVEPVVISAPAFQEVEFTIIGTATYCQNRFSQKAKTQMEETQKGGSQNKKGKQKEKKDFEQLFHDAQYKSAEGWAGIPAHSFRNAMISACRIVGFKMTQAKLSIFVSADGVDAHDGTPLVRIHGDPVMRVHPVRNSSGVVDLRARPFWDNWRATLRVRFDSDLFRIQDVANLLSRVGQQVGIGEGRPDSKMSAGMGWGLFRLAEEE